MLIALLNKLILMHHHNLISHLIIHFTSYSWKSFTVNSTKIGAHKLVHLFYTRYWWLELYYSIRKLLFTCGTFKYTKDSALLFFSFFYTMPFPTTHFWSWSMDFITNFAIAYVFNAIFIHIDWLTKYTKLIPCFLGEKILAATQAAHLFSTIL